MKLNIYLSFNGNCEEAMNLYKDCFGGHFSILNRFKDGPGELGGTKIPESHLEKIMHMTWNFDENTVMASDSFGIVQFGENTTLSIHMDNKSKMEETFEFLSSGGTVKLPIQDTFWGSRFGMLTDKFGIQWMFSYDLAKDENE